MSLINDALKRAKQVQQKSPPPPASGRPLRPVESARPRSSALGLLWPIAVALLLLMIAAGVIWFVVARAGAARPVADAPNSKPVTQAATATTPKPIPTATQPRPAPAIKSNSTTPPSPAAVPAPVGDSRGRVPVATTNAPAVLAEVPSVLPKLQGIFYRPNRPSALLNGKTVMIGGRSGEFLVVAITQQSVTVARAGKTNVLSLPE